MPFSFLDAMLGVLLIVSASGIVFFKKPLYASLSFLVTLLLLAASYLKLSAEFIAATQVIVYAGAILVIFVFVVVLFQDFYERLALIKEKSSLSLRLVAVSVFLIVFGFFTGSLFFEEEAVKTLPASYGSAKSIGKLLYVDFFFPFEATLPLFLVAIVGSLYMAKKETEK